MLATDLLATSLPRPAFSAADLCRALRSAAPGRRLDLAGFDRVLVHDVERNLMELQAGVRWGSLPIPEGQAFSPGTVGESLAANDPGPDGRPLIAHVRGLTVATADGELRRASPDRSPELFRLVVGGFGAIGPYYSITLDLQSLAQAFAQGETPVRLEEAAPSPLAGPRLDVGLLLPPEACDGALRAVRGLLAEHRCTLELLEARRTLPEHESCLQWARREYAALRIRLGICPTLGAAVGAAQLRSRLFDLAIAAGGAFRPVELPHASRAQAESCYPSLAGFLAEQRRLDPTGRIDCPWLRGVRRAWCSEPCPVRWARD